MFPQEMQDPEYPTYTGGRLDGQNLVLEWIKNKKVNGTVDFTSVIIRLSISV